MGVDVVTLLTIIPENYLSLYPRLLTSSVGCSVGCQSSDLVPAGDQTAANGWLSAEPKEE